MTEKIGEEDEFLGGPDPDNPCPKCGMTTQAPVDGSGRICFECGWSWYIGDPPEKGEWLPMKRGRITHE